jgi:hypothetical protein
VNVGPVIEDPLGISGEAIIRTARLVDAPAFKTAMATPGYGLGIIVSTFVYETAIGHFDELIDDPEYKMVDVINKEFTSPAWIRLVQAQDPAIDISSDRETSAIETNDDQGQTSPVETMSGQDRLPENAELINSDEILRSEWSTVNDGIQAIYKILGPPPLKTLAKEGK